MFYSLSGIVNFMYKMIFMSLKSEQSGEIFKQMKYMYNGLEFDKAQHVCQSTKT